jgi:hypothetical protein
LKSIVFFIEADVSRWRRNFYDSFLGRRFQLKRSSGVADGEGNAVQLDAALARPRIATRPEHDLRTHLALRTRVPVVARQKSVENSFAGRKTLLLER